MVGCKEHLLRLFHVSRLRKSASMEGIHRHAAHRILLTRLSAHLPADAERGTCF